MYKQITIKDFLKRCWYWEIRDEKSRYFFLLTPAFLLQVALSWDKDWNSHTLWKGWKFACVWNWPLYEGDVIFKKEWKFIRETITYREFYEQKRNKKYY